MNISKENIVGKIVAADYRAAEVFKSRNIDFCCNGNRSIGEVCETAAIDTNILIAELNEITKQNEGANIDYRAWDMDLLADYIQKKHHRYVEKNIPILTAYLNKIVAVHGKQHPELIEINALFTASAAELLAHMKKEEMVLFPYVQQMMDNATTQKPPFGTVQNPIAMMMHEHDTEGDRFRKIAALSNNYTPPADACNTYTVTFSLLKEFEADLHLHIHLENNILFPKAIETEKALAN